MKKQKLFNKAIRLAALENGSEYLFKPTTVSGKKGFINVGFVQSTAYPGIPGVYEPYRWVRGKSAIKFMLKCQHRLYS
ncbi:MAG: hypothetical protein ACRDBG_06150 [Waterburya sp.]